MHKQNQQNRIVHNKPTYRWTTSNKKEDHISIPRAYLIPSKDIFYSRCPDGPVPKHFSYNRFKGKELQKFIDNDIRNSPLKDYIEIVCREIISPMLLRGIEKIKLGTRWLAEELSVNINVANKIKKRMSKMGLIQLASMSINTYADRSRNTVATWTINAQLICTKQRNLRSNQEIMHTLVLNRGFREGTNLFVEAYLKALQVAKRITASDILAAIEQSPPNTA